MIANILDKWIKKTDKISYRYFCLDSLSIKDCSTSWFTYDEYIKIKETKTILCQMNNAKSNSRKHMQLEGPLYLCIDNKIKDKFMEQDNSNIRYTLQEQQLKILRSNIQKSIRRMNIVCAINTSYLFLLANQSFELLRRLTIITIEDVMINKFYPILVWLMAVSGKIDLPFNSYINNWLMNYIHMLACELWQDTSIFDKTNIDKIVLKDLNKEHQNVILSIDLRLCYNGMNGDTEMLNKCMSHYFNRFNANKKSIFLSLYNLCYLPNIDYTILKSDYMFDKKYILPYAIDQHCSGICEKFNIVSAYKPEDDTYLKQIKTAVWYNWSSVNYRMNIKLEKGTDTNIELWNEIKNRYEKEAINILDKFII